MRFIDILTDANAPLPPGQFYYYASDKDGDLVLSMEKVTGNKTEYVKLKGVKGIDWAPTVIKVQDLMDEIKNAKDSGGTVHTCAISGHWDEVFETLSLPSVYGADSEGHFSKWADGIHYECVSLKETDDQTIGHGIIYYHGVPFGVVSLRYDDRRVIVFDKPTYSKLYKDFVESVYLVADHHIIDIVDIDDNIIGYLD